MYLVVLGLIMTLIVMVLVARYRSIREEHFVALAVPYPVNRYEYNAEHQTSVEQVCSKLPHLCRIEIPSDMLVFIDKNGSVRETDMPIDFLANCMTQATADTDCVYGIFGNMAPDYQLEFVNKMIQDVYDMDESTFARLRNMITKDYKETSITSDNKVKLVTFGGLERVLSANETHIILLAVYLSMLSRDQGLPMPTFDNIGDTDTQKNNLFTPRTNPAFDTMVMSMLSSNPTCDRLDDQLFDAYDAGSYNGAPITSLNEDAKLGMYIRNWHQTQTNCTLDKLVQIGFSSPYNIESHSGSVSGDPAGLGQDPGGQDPGGQDPGGSVSGASTGASTGAPISSSGPGGSGTQSAPYAPPTGTLPSTAGELLVIKRWRTQEWANSNSTENHRNTLISKLHNLSKADPNSDELPISVLQSLLDYELIQIGLTYPGT